MTTEITAASGNLPTDSKTGLTLPLSRSLGSQELGKHRAMVAVELEVMAKKMDRFGWERDRNSAAHDRLLSDWMDALHDYPLDEVRAACRDWVMSSPRKMPNEGDILSIIKRQRFETMQAHKAKMPAPRPAPKDRVSKDRAAEILAEVGFAPRPMPDTHD